MKKLLATIWSLACLVGCSAEIAWAPDADHEALDAGVTGTVDAGPVWICPPGDNGPHGCNPAYCSDAAWDAWLRACWSDGVARPQPTSR